MQHAVFKVSAYLLCEQSVGPHSTAGSQIHGHSRRFTCGRVSSVMMSQDWGFETKGYGQGDRRYKVSNRVSVGLQSG